MMTPDAGGMPMPMAGAPSEGDCAADSDGDGSGDCDDACPDDGNKTMEGACGCGVPDTDRDGDGQLDCEEACPDDPDKIDPGLCGCGNSDGDSDGDGAIDCQEECPADGTRTTPGTCGCLGNPLGGLSTPCSDGLCPGEQTCDGGGACGSVSACQQPSGVSCDDGVVHDGHIYYRCTSQRSWDDARTACRSAFGFDLAVIDDAEEETFALRLGSSTLWVGGRLRAGTDTFEWTRQGTAFWQGDAGSGSAVGGAYTDWLDEEPNASGECPDDPAKVEPGVCGCGNADSDGDGDGMADCVDGCPTDGNKTAPGTCGCGVSDGDSDGDGAIDCAESCPQDGNRLEPATCGCVGAPAGDTSTSCQDGVCPGQFTCDGAGSCGTLAECQRPAGVTCSAHTFRGHVYYRCTSQRSWDAARTACQSAFGFDLARVDDAAEQSFLLGLGTAATWIGARVGGSGAMEWVLDGQPLTYTDWLDGEPNDSGECLRLYDGDGWADGPCGTTDTFICESLDDECPSDPDKVRPGACGCGTADTDSDGDGTADCNDQCPADPNKTAPDVCGCVGNPSPAAAGTACADAGCFLNTACDGAGTCGRVDACDPPAGDCGTLQQYGGHAYWFCTSGRSWSAARTLCQSRGMELARIDDAAENEFIRSHLANEAWHGAYHAGNSVWRWSDNDDELWSGQSGGSGSLYTNWSSGEPDANNSDNQCGEINDNSTGNWDDDGCGYNQDLVCESL